jgi:two-component system, LytTR family, sensor kinase
MEKVVHFARQHGLVVVAHLLMMTLLLIVSSFQKFVLLFAVSTIIPIYFNHFTLIPRLLNRRQLWRYIGNVVLMLVAYYALIYLVVAISFHLGESFGLSKYHPQGYFDNMFFGRTLSLTMLLVIVGLVTSIIRLMADSMAVSEMRERLSSIQSDKVAAELTGLKSQINPHFFFNALNSIYALSLDASPQTPAYILKLSGLMRYVLYECNQPFVPLSKEVEFLRAYIDLQEIRLSEGNQVCFDVRVDDDQQPVAPLLFLPLVENCFKHGLCGGVNATIGVRLHADGESIRFYTENPCNPAIITKGDRERGRIGLNNVAKRLELSYPGRHAVSYQANDRIFTSEITIQP